MDPLTAAMQALTALNTFLVTPAGQKLALDQEAIFTNILNALGLHIAAGAPAPPKAS